MKKFLSLLIVTTMLTAMFCTFTVSAAAAQVDEVTAAQDWTVENTTFDAAASTLSDGTNTFKLKVTNVSETEKTFSIGPTAKKAGIVKQDTLCIPQSFVSDGITYTCTAIDGGVLTGSDCAASAFVKKVILPETVTALNGNAFKNCTALEEINLPAGLTKIDSYALGRTAVSSVTIPASVTSIGAQAFIECSNLASITFAEDSILTTIGNNAFQGCSLLTSIDFPQKVKTLGSDLFSGTGITEFNINANITGLNSGPFKGSKISVITVDENNTAFTVGDDGVVYNKAKNSVAIYPPARKGDYILPESVTAINDYAFYGSALTSFTFTAKITKIGQTAFMASDLAEVTFAEGFKMNSLPQRLFSGTKLTTVTIPASVTSLGANLFENCTLLEKVNFESLDVSSDGYSVVIPKTIKTIGDSTFSYCSAVTSVGFEDGSPITATPQYFLRGSGVEYVQLPLSITNIKYHSFASTKNLKTVVFGPFGPKADTEGIVIPNTVTTLGNNIFCESAIPSVDFEKDCTITALPVGFLYKSTTKSIVIPASVTTLKKDCFKEASIDTINGSDKVFDLSTVTGTIESGALMATYSLKGEIIINAENVNGDSFKQTTGITKVVFGSNVKNVAAAFTLDTNIEHLIFLGKTVPTLNNIYGRISEKRSKNYTVYYPVDGIGYEDNTTFYNTSDKFRNYNKISGCYIAAAANKGDSVNLSYTLAEPTASESKKMFAAIYNSEGMLISVKTVDPVGNFVNLDSSSDAALAKVFIWNGVNSATPLYEASVYSLVNE